MSLNDRILVNLKMTGKQYRKADGGGLFINVSPVGGKLWRLSYRFGGKQKMLSLGAYPGVTLKMARERRDAAKELLAKGVDPGVAKQEEKKQEKALVENTFQNVALAWHTDMKSTWTEKNAGVILRRIQRDLLPHLGSKSITEIEAADVLDCARLVASRGALDYAHRLLQYCGMIFRWAIANRKAKHNIIDDLKGALPSAQVKHHASITDPEKVGELMRAIDNYDARVFPVKCALRLAPLVFVRPGELRGAEWSEFSFEKTEWRIPAERMKMGEQHIVPLSRQVLEILIELKKHTGHGRLLFPSLLDPERPMSDGTINTALRRMGYAKDELTGHGFRSMASTLLNELGWNRDAIERQLAHGERNTVRAAYNFAEFLPERRKMMQAWADYLDELKNATLAR